MPGYRRRAWWIALALAAMTVGCDAANGAPGTPATSPVVSATSPEPSSSASSPSAAPGADPAGHGWTWQGPEPGFGSSFYKEPIVVETKRGPCRFVFDEKQKTQAIECLTVDENTGTTERAWGHDEAGGFVEDAALAADDERLFAALFSNISTGCELRVYKLGSGEELWRMPLVGVGPVGHSEYLNEVQISLLPGQVQVLGWESAGRYIEIVDANAGRTLSTLRITKTGTQRFDLPAPKPAEAPHPGAALGVPWKWEGSQQIRKGHDVTIPVAGGAACSLRFEPDQRKAHLECTSGKKRIWGFDLADQSSPSGAIAADDKLLYHAQHSRIASGATIGAFDLKTGRLAWKSALFALGPVAHSQYMNEVLLRLEKGRLVVSGWESGGKYVEVLDTVSGNSIGNRKE